MKITCDSCGAKYTIADDKVRGRKVKIRCKGCGTPIVVDGQHEGASAASEDAPGTELEATVPLEAPAPTAEGEWSVNLSETEQRTLTTPQIVEAWRAGTLTSDAFVWREGMADWLPILECAELAPLLTPASSSAAPSPVAAAAPAQAAFPATKPSSSPTKPSSSPTSAERPPASAARVAGGRAQGAPDLFAGVERAGADEEDVSTSAPVLPQAGTRPYEDDRMTGARNENSVLFSLDALKAGFAGPSTKPAAPSADRRGASAPSSADPFGMGGASALPGLGGPTPLFSLADNQALLTAPPPPEPPPRPVEAVFTPGGATAAPPAGKRNLVLLGVGAVVLLVAGLALGIGLGGKEDDAEVAASASASALARTDSSDDKPSEKSEPGEEKPTTAVKEEPAADAGKSEEAPAASGAAKPTSAPVAGGARGPVAKKEEPKKEEPKPAGGGAEQPFNKAAAISALGSAAGQASSCKKIGGPTGSGKVSVTFAPSGRATSANVLGAPFAGTAVGGCIASVFRRAKVPPFSGSALTVSKSFTIN